MVDSLLEVHTILFLRWKEKNKWHLYGNFSDKEPNKYYKAGDSKLGQTQYKTEEELYEIFKQTL